MGARHQDRGIADRWGADPTREAWERWRRPVLVVVAAVWSAVAAALYSLRPINVVGLAVPSSLLLSAWWTYRTADRFAEVERRITRA